MNELKLFYFDKNWDAHKAKNSIHAACLKRQGIELYTKGEAQAMFLAHEQKKIDEQQGVVPEKPAKKNKKK